MKKTNKKKNIILVILIILVLGMAVGYAAFSTMLTIDGTANITSSWDIHINSITPGTLVGATSVNGYPRVEADNITATFQVNLAYPGASATYEIEVHNNGTVPAILDEIGGTLATANAAEPTGVTFAFDAVQGDTLEAGATKVYTVTTTWDAGDTTVPLTTSKTVSITLNYIQNT
ncbi:MAG TPA: hypothetical protein PK993_01425 [Clostridia bacterium]|nr:hypothetical protein [Clostridia bacterium]